VCRNVVLNEIVERDWFFTMRAGSTDAYPAAERRAVLAILCAEEPDVADGALVHRDAAA